MPEDRGSYADRQMNAHFKGLPRSSGTKCLQGAEHNWLPVSFRFETQLLDGWGRVDVRQPAINDGHVYFICMGCRSWSYMRFDYVGYQLGGPEDVDPTLMVEEAERLG
ncbi:hypothetical protein AB0L65_32990 [Nonomuraea sp. NPDC052116]|uniref:hypothetical protein n=1 Tax=Nonomuraea sp. NPDC052116 TaxID=3155665 RepID=UPI003423D8F4